MKRGICLGVLMLAGCIGPDEPIPPTNLPPPPSCEGTLPLQLGRCIDSASGGDCRGYAEEVPSFEAMPVGGSIPMVYGPQGASMFIIAVRAEGIDPGDPEHPVGPGNPLVEITVVNEEGKTLSVLRSYSAFEAVADEEGLFFHGGFFVVIDDRCPSGSLLTAVATLEDPMGNTLCGELEFLADCRR